MSSLLHICFSVIYFFNVQSISKAGRACPRESRLAFRNFHEWCFTYVDDPMPWQQAREYCNRAGGDLAKIENAAENGFAASLIVHKLISWIGLSDRLHERKYNWTDRTPMTYANWGRGEPNNYGSDEDCVTIAQAGTWHDVPCWKYQPFICETDTVADCCSLDVPEGLLVDTNDTAEGTTVHFRCEAGYFLSGGDMTRTCQPNEVWSGAMPQCHKKTCGKPPAVAMATWSGGNMYGDVVTCVCKPGYYVSQGNKTLTCGSDGSWQGIKPKCSKGTAPGTQAKQTGSGAGTPLHKTWYIYVICGLVILSVAVVIVGVLLWRRYAGPSRSHDNGFHKRGRDDPFRHSTGSTDTSVTNMPDA